MKDFYLIPAITKGLGDIYEQNPLTYGQFTPFGMDEKPQSIFPYEIAEGSMHLGNPHFLYIPSQRTLIGLVNEEFKPLGNFGISQRPMADAIAYGLMDSEGTQEFEGPVKKMIVGYHEYLKMIPRRDDRLKLIEENKLLIRRKAA